MNIGHVRIVALAFFGFGCAFNLSAHEYWLDPIDSSVKLGESVIVDVRNGQNFTGASFPYDASKFNSIVVSSPMDKKHYTGRLGDYPAIHPNLTEAGLHSISVETTAKILEYKTWQQFTTFLTYHGLENVVEVHKKRNLPVTDIKERYFRSAKTLVLVNHTGELELDAKKPTDLNEHQALSVMGATFELILLDNPYSNTESIRAKLLYQSEPLMGRQVEMFWKGSNALRLTSVTNADGIATFKMRGEGDYLINAVHVTKPIRRDVDWISHWASVTFER